MICLTSGRSDGCKLYQTLPNFPLLCRKSMVARIIKCLEVDLTPRLIRLLISCTGNSRSFERRRKIFKRFSLARALKIFVHACIKFKVAREKLGWRFYYITLSHGLFCNPLILSIHSTIRAKRRTTNGGGVGEKELIIACQNTSSLPRYSTCLPAPDFQNLRIRLCIEIEKRKWYKRGHSHF